MWLVPTVVTGLACALGWRSRSTGAAWWGPALGLLATAMAVVVIVVALILREPGVVLAQFLFGVGVGVLGLALAPVLGFYALGYFVRGPRLAGVLWIAGTIPLGIYVWLVGFVFLFGVACEPGCMS